MQEDLVAETGPPTGAAALARGVSRYFATRGAACLLEFSLKTGRRADIMALDRDGTFTIVEIKSSRPDFQSDRKWPEYLDYCDRFFFAVGPGFPVEILPEECGLIVADAYDAEIVRDSAVCSLNGSRRRHLTLRFARAAGQRVMRTLDPGLTL